MGYVSLLPRTGAAVTITRPTAGASVLSGRVSAAVLVGALVTVRRDGVVIGTPAVAADRRWTLTGILPVLDVGDVIEAAVVSAAGLTVMATATPRTIVALPVATGGSIPQPALIGVGLVQAVPLSSGGAIPQPAVLAAQIVQAVPLSSGGTIPQLIVAPALPQLFLDIMGPMAGQSEITAYGAPLSTMVARWQAEETDARYNADIAGDWSLVGLYDRAGVYFDMWRMTGNAVYRTRAEESALKYWNGHFNVEGTAPHLHYIRGLAGLYALTGTPAGFPARLKTQMESGLLANAYYWDTIGQLDQSDPNRFADNRSQTAILQSALYLHALGATPMTGGYAPLNGLSWAAIAELTVDRILASQGADGAWQFDFPGEPPYQKQFMAARVCHTLAAEYLPIMRPDGARYRQVMDAIQRCADWTWTNAWDSGSPTADVLTSGPHPESWKYVVAGPEVVNPAYTAANQPYVPGDSNVDLNLVVTAMYSGLVKQGRTRAGSTPGVDDYPDIVRRAITSATSNFASNGNPRVFWGGYKQRTEQAFYLDRIAHDLTSTTPERTVVVTPLASGGTIPEPLVYPTQIIAVTPLASGGAIPQPAIIIPVTTWNPADKASGVVLSNGNLTAGRTGGSYYNAVRGPLLTGKVMWEVILDVGGTMVAGIAPTSQGLTIGPTDAETYTWNPGGQNIAKGGAYLADAPAGGTIPYRQTYMVDTAANRMWVGPNGTISGDPVAGTGGAALTQGFVRYAYALLIDDGGGPQCTLVSNLTIPTAYAAAGFRNLQGGT